MSAIKHIRKTSCMAIAIVLLFASCSKKNAAEPAAFDVTSTRVNGTASSSFSTKDTVLFKFTGNPDMITFYSGEVGKRYDYITRTNAAGTPQLQFNTLRAAGTQGNSLALLISADFKGVVAGMVNGVFTRDTALTNANIAAASWTDITSRATLSTGAAAAVPSGIIGLSDFSKGQPVYIAFKYTATAGSVQNKWTITSLSLNNVLNDGTTYTIASLNSAASAITNYGNSTYGPGWAVSYDPAKNANNIAWVYTDKTSLVITGSATLPTANAEAWAIMGPVDLTRVTPDVGLNIKSITAKLPAYQYNYTTAGTYNPVFVGGNFTPDASSVVIKKTAITVTP